MKKTVLTILLIFGISICFGQSPEQVAIDFYAKKFSKENKGNRIRFDGKVKIYEEKQAKIIISKFYYCKIKKKSFKNDSIKINYSNIDKIHEQLKKIKIVFEKSNSEKLEIPDNFKYRKKLKFKNFKGSFLKFYTNKIWHWFFPYKFNFAIEPAVKLNEFYYVRMTIVKNDSEYGSEIIVKISKDLKVVDWCEEYWIQ